MLNRRRKFRSTECITSYHVHLYYDGSTKQHASFLRTELQKKFKNNVLIGRWRDLSPQGPHIMSHFQVSFKKETFSEIVSFLALNRGDLRILLHPNTGDGYEDHTKNVMWIGPSISLNANSLRNIE